jgi:hypothetical protein
LTGDHPDPARQTLDATELENSFPIHSQHAPQRDLATLTLCGAPPSRCTTSDQPPRVGCSTPCLKVNQIFIVF